MHNFRRMGAAKFGQTQDGDFKKKEEKRGGYGGGDSDSIDFDEEDKKNPGKKFKQHKLAF